MPLILSFLLGPPIQSNDVLHFAQLQCVDVIRISDAIEEAEEKVEEAYSLRKEEGADHQKVKQLNLFCLLIGNGALEQQQL